MFLNESGGVLNWLHSALEQDITNRLFVKQRYSSLRVMLSVVAAVVGIVDLGGKG